MKGKIRLAIINPPTIKQQVAITEGICRLLIPMIA
jgi:hypothetical protein